MKAKFLRGKKSKTQKLTKKSQSSSRVMPCQKYNVDFQKLFFDDRQSHNKLSQTYLNKMNQYQRQSLNVHKQLLDLQVKNELSEKYNKKLYSNNKNLKKKNKQLLEENAILTEQVQQLQQQQDLQIKSIKKNFLYETDLFHKYYQKKIQELRNMYKSILTPEQYSQMNKIFQQDEQQIQSAKDYKSSETNDNFYVHNTQPNFNGGDTQNKNLQFKKYMQNKNNNLNFAKTKNM